MSTIIIGSARIGENGRVTGGAGGDQKQLGTGDDYKGEVSMQALYNHKKGWFVFIPLSREYAIKIANNMIFACNNANLGYNQNDRLGVIKYGIHTSVKTNCDCSSLVRECFKEATGRDPGNFTTSTEVKVLEKTGLVDVFPYYDGDTLYTGDILVTKTKGHTAIVVRGEDRKSVV